MSQMEDENRRADVIAMYPGARWRQRVLRMSDAQVFAIWKKQQEKLEKEKQQKASGPPQQDSIPF